jgi:hypothetical protein
MFIIFNNTSNSSIYFSLCVVNNKLVSHVPHNSLHFTVLYKFNVRNINIFPMIPCLLALVNFGEFYLYV